VDEEEYVQRTREMSPDGQVMIRIMLVDDHAVMRAGTRRFLEDESDFLVVGEASDGDEALELAEHVEAAWRGWLPDENE
jgi:CheY-like chemotaxis protein